MFREAIRLRKRRAGAISQAYEAREESNDMGKMMKLWGLFGILSVMTVFGCGREETVIFVTSSETSTGGGSVVAEFSKGGKYGRTCYSQSRVLQAGEDQRLEACVPHVDTVLTAVPAHGSRFVEWAEGCPDFADVAVCSLGRVRTDPVHITVVFEQIP